MTLSILAGLLFAASVSAGPPPSNAGKQDLTFDQYKNGIDLLQNWLEQRGEDRETVELFTGDIKAAFQDEHGNQKVPVTREAFEAFLAYERAWQRARKDSQNAQIPKAQLQKELLKLQQTKKAFDTVAQADSPKFYAAFKKAGADSRAHRQQNGIGTGGGAGSLFTSPGGASADSADAAVDAGADALQQGDAGAAAADASQAISQNPQDSEAYALRAAANMDQGNNAAAAQDAQAALALDPNNTQAQAIAGMTSNMPGSFQGSRAASDAAAVAGGLSGSPAPDSSRGGQAALAAAPGDRGPGMPSGPAGQIGNMIDLKKLQNTAAPPPGGQAGSDPGFSGSWQDSARWAPKNAPPNPGQRYKGVADIPPAAASASGDAAAFYAKAQDLAQKGDRDGVIEALRSAAALDESFKPILEDALRMPDGISLTDFFVRNANKSAAARRAPAAPMSPYAKLMMGFACLGGVFLAAGAWILLAPARRRRKSV